MAVTSATQANIGIRRSIGTLGWRNFEGYITPTQAYNSNRSQLNWLDGNTYNVGTALPFDVGGVSYSPAAVDLLQLYWNQTWISSTV